MNITIHLHANTVIIHLLSSGELTVEGVLKQHRVKFITGDQDRPYRISVRRSSILEDILDEIRFGFDESKHLRITFMGGACCTSRRAKKRVFYAFDGCNC